jgi:hypothetical protein
MSNIIDDTENLLILILLFGIIGCVIYLWLQLKAPGSGWNNPENPQYGLNQRNANGWLHYFFPETFPLEDDDDPAWSADDYQIVDNYQPDLPALQQAVQNAPSAIQQWLQGLGSNPGATTIGSSPLF